MVESPQKNNKIKKFGESKKTTQDIYVQKTNRLILFCGIIGILFFFGGLYYLSLTEDHDIISGGMSADNIQLDSNFIPSTPNKIEQIISQGVSNTDDALEILPKDIDITNILVGTKGSAVISLVPKSGRIVRIEEIDFSSVSSKDGMKVEVPCANDTILEGRACNIDISWEPKAIASGSGIISVRWNEDTLGGPSGSTVDSHINVKFSSVDKNLTECGVCKPSGETSEPKKLAVSFSDKILGVIDSDGKLIDENSVVLGRMLSDGTILSLNSQVIGIAVNLGGVIDDSGEYIGTLNRDGSVIDKNGNALGRINSKYNVVDVSGKVIGYPVPRGFVIDGNGITVGEVAEDGKVFSMQSVEIGKIRKDGVAYDKAGKLVLGRLVPQGLVIAPGCKTIGVAMPNGSVVDGFNRNVGKIMQNGTVVDRNGNIIAALVRGGVIADLGGTVKGTVSIDGSVINTQGGILGCMLSNGNISDENNKIIGGVIPSGPTVIKGCQPQGEISGDGRVLNASGKEIGNVNYNGDVVDANKVKIGYAVYRRKHSLHANIGNKDDLLYGAYFSEQPIANDKCSVYYTDNNAKVTTKSVDACVDSIGYLRSKKGTAIGRLPYVGNIIGKDAKIIGAVSYEGKALDKKGNPIGCVASDGTVISNKTKDTTYIGDVALILPVINAAGNILGYSFVNGHVYDSEGNDIGHVLPGGNVIDKNGVIIGYLAKKGVVVKNDGKFVGRVGVNGLVENANGDEVGHILANETVLSNKTIIGRFFEDNSSVIVAVDNNGKLEEIIGLVDNNGRIKAKDLTLSLRADGRVIDVNGDFRGDVLPSGIVSDFFGNVIGRADGDGTAYNSQKQLIGYVYPNSVVLNEGNEAVGIVTHFRSLLIDNRGYFSGYGTKGNYVFDIKGKEIGSSLPDGTVVNSDGNILGRLVDEGVVINRTGMAIGYVNSEANAVRFNGEKIGMVMPDGLIVNSNGEYVGSILPTGTVSGIKGEDKGRVSPDGTVTDHHGYDIGKVLPNRRVVNANAEIIGGVIPQGIVVNDYAEVVGVTMADGGVLSKNGDAGRVLYNGLVLDKNTNSVIGRVIPFGTAAIDNYGDIIGFINRDGKIKNKDVEYKVNARGFVLDKNSEILGALMPKGIAVDAHGDVVGHVMPDGSVINVKEHLLIGRVVAGGLVIDKQRKVIAKVVEDGIAVDSYSKFVGYVDYDGSVLNSNFEKVGVLSSGKVVLDVKTRKPFAKLVKEETVISSTGELIGRVTANGAVLDEKSAKIGRILADGIAVGEDGNYIGGLAKSGAVFTRAGEYRGVVGLNGKVYRLSANTNEKSLPDGTVVRDNKNEPEKIAKIEGYVTEIGVPIGANDLPLGYMALDGSVIGRSSITGKVYDNSYVFNEGNVVGVVSPTEAIIGGGCSYAGMSSFDGNIINGRNEKIGILTAGLLGIDRNKTVIGGIRLEGPVINEACELVGYAGPDGHAMDKNFRPLGCVNENGMVYDGQKKIGFVYPRGIVVSLDGNEEKGRTIFDGHVIDAENNMIGCVKSDLFVVGEVGGTNIGKVYRHDFYNRKRMEVASGYSRHNFQNDTNAPYIKSDTLLSIDKNGHVVDEKGNIILGPDGKPLTVDKNGNLITSDGRYVLGADGKPLRVDEKGNVVDSEGNIVRGNLFKKIRLGPDGKTIVDEYGNAVLGADGKPLTVDSEGFVVDSKGNRILDKYGKPLRVDANGNVVDSRGEIVKIGLDGNIIDSSNSNPLSKMHLGSDGITIVDEHGNPVLGPDGKPLTIDSEGYVIDSKGNRILDKYGKPLRVDSDGNVVDSRGEFVKISSNGRVVDADGNILTGNGIRKIHLSPDGKTILDEYGNPVLGPDGKPLSIDAEGYVIDSNGNRILDKYGKPLRVDANGNIVDSEGKIVMIDKDGNIIDQSGKILSGNGIRKMRLGPDGKTIVDEYGNPVLGPDGKPLTIDAEGYVVDSNGNRILDKYGKPLRVDANGNVVDSKGDLVMVNRDNAIIDADGNIVRKGAKKRIALDLNGNKFGIVLANGDVVDENGIVKGHVVGDDIFGADGRKVLGVIVDDDDERIEPRDVYVNGGYREGVGGYNLPPLKQNSYSGAAEYDKKSLEEILKKQQERRSRMETKRITSKKFRKKVYRDWSHASPGYQKIVSSKPINMDRLIMKGKAIPAVLASSISTALPDNPVLAVVDRNVYGETGREILIPAGSKLVGKVGGNIGNPGWVTRISVVWERVVRPDGVMFDLVEATSGDAHGRGGVIGYSDQQVFKRYVLPLIGQVGKSAILYALADFANGAITLDSDGKQVKSEKAEAEEDARKDLVDGLGDLWTKLMAELAQIKLVTQVPSGTRITVYASNDMFIRTPEDDEALEKMEAEAAMREESSERQKQQNRRSGGSGAASHRSKGGASSVVKTGESGNPGNYQGVIQDNPDDRKNLNPNNRGQASYYRGAPGVGTGNNNQGTGGTNQSAPQMTRGQARKQAENNNQSKNGNIPAPSPYLGGEYQGATGETQNNSQPATPRNDGRATAGVVEGESVPKLF